ncbi:MAG: UDP-N-acetylglucosamine 1-carboxyvinyltransferase [Acutalibacteraceae bacterium]
MSKLLVDGQKKLSGDVEVQGSKNSALPLLAASLLTKDECVFYSCPRLSDIDAATEILRYLGGKVKREGHTMVVNTKDVCRFDIPKTLMKEMRSSIVFLGAMISINKRAKLYFPGGCELGPRPIDLHLSSLKKMGVIIKEKHGVIDCHAPKGLKGAKIALSFPSVGATENIIIAAVLAEGTTTVTNCAREPEIIDLCEFLNSCGAKIYGAGEGTIVIDGVTSLKGVCHTIIPDRIVVATLMSACASTRGNIRIEGIVRNHLETIIPIFSEMGCHISVKEGIMDMRCKDSLISPTLIRTMPYPGFPTDAQAILMAVCAKASGTTVFVENIFESRYKHVIDLVKMGADISVEGKVAIVKGVENLYGAEVEATDLRGGASLVVAALSAEGTTEIDGIKYIERGYEDFDVVLSSLGADIRKV